MKRLSLLTITIFLALSLTACNNTVTLKIPSSVLDDGISLDEYAGKNGIVSVKQISSFFLEVTMTKSKHREFVRRSTKSVKSSFANISEKEATVYIKKITHDKYFRNITVEVDKPGYESATLDTEFNRMDLDQIGLWAIMHQVYSGMEQRAEVIFIDNITKETLSTYVYPEAISPY